MSTLLQYILENRKKWVYPELEKQNMGFKYEDSQYCNYRTR